MINIENGKKLCTLSQQRKLDPASAWFKLLFIDIRMSSELGSVEESR